MLSEAVKILKGEYTIRAIKQHKMDKAIIFCRTKVDCDNMENYLIKAGGGGRQLTCRNKFLLFVYMTTLLSPAFC